MDLRDLGPVLVANRGEIARRVFATCRRLGVETIAVYSDADADLPFVAEADHAARLPGSTPAETYLDAELIVRTARATLICRREDAERIKQLHAQVGEQFDRDYL